MSSATRTVVANGTTNGTTNGTANGTNGVAKELNGSDLKKQLKSATTNPPKVYIGAAHKEFNPSSNDSMDGNQ